MQEHLCSEGIGEKPNSPKQTTPRELVTAADISPTSTFAVASATGDVRPVASDITNASYSTRAKRGLYVDIGSKQDPGTTPGDFLSLPKEVESHSRSFLLYRNPRFGRKHGAV